LANLRASLKQLLPAEEARSLAAMIAAMIDGVWLRAALSGWREADSGGARALLTAFVDGRLRERLSEAPQTSRGARPPGAGERFASINPASGEVIGYCSVAGPVEVDAAVAAAGRAQRAW